MIGDGLFVAARSQVKKRKQKAIQKYAFHCTSNFNSLSLVVKAIFNFLETFQCIGYDNSQKPEKR